jgi:hypothetical protein
MTATIERLTVPTCVGCGAMGTLGTCATGCREQRLELVRGAAYDEIIAARRRLEADGHALRAVIDELVSEAPDGGADDHERAYRSAQRRARSALREHPPDPAADAVADEPTATATAWWCPECNAIDAPQPCLGICVWRPVEWVEHGRYDEERELVLSARAEGEQLRLVLRRLATVTPREGQWERSWRVLRDEARIALGAGAG